MIKIIDYTEKPLTHMGRIASICTNSKPSADIGRKCLQANHGRVLEYVDVTMEISGYSARVIRELYTHIVGVSRLQESTRFINMNDFKYYTPRNIKMNDDAYFVYTEVMEQIRQTYRKLLDLGIPKEDAANVLPLAYKTKIVLKINLRALLHLFNERMCRRAYQEFRELVYDIAITLAGLDEEWKEIMDKYAVPKCDMLGYCPELKSCKEDKDGHTR